MVVVSPSAGSVPMTVSGKLTPSRTYAVLNEGIASGGPGGKARAGGGWSSPPRAGAWPAEGGITGGFGAARAALRPSTGRSGGAAAGTYHPQNSGEGAG